MIKNKIEIFLYYINNHIPKMNNQEIMNNALNNIMNNAVNNANLNIQMNPNTFYEYINILIHEGYSKYNAIIIFLNDVNINATYKRIPEVQQELEEVLLILNN
jgi:hypothetical protein